MTERRLTDEDVKAVVKELREQITTTFYQDLGKGLWAAVVRAVMAALIGFAAYASVKGLGR